MIYVLLAIGIILIITGIKLKENETKRRGKAFREVMSVQERDKGEYIKLMALNQELLNRVGFIEQRTEEIINNLALIQHSVGNMLSMPDDGSKGREQEEAQDYSDVVSKIDKMMKCNMSVDEIATSLNMGKGEVLLIQRLLQK